jgi:hypothetical protein
MVWKRRSVNGNENELTVSKINNAHDFEDDRQSDRRQYDEAEAVEKLEQKREQDRPDWKTVNSSMVNGSLFGRSK